MSTAKKEETFYYTAEEYYAVTRNEERKSELHEGEIVWLASAGGTHNDIALGLASELRSFVKKNQGKCIVRLLNFDFQLSEKTVVVPDVAIVCDRSKLNEKRCIGAPDLAVEIISSNWKDDFVKKMAYYEEYGVKEYWIIDPRDRTTHVFIFGESDSPKRYAFDTPIPVGIWEGALSVTIAEYLTDHTDYTE